MAMGSKRTPVRIQRAGHDAFRLLISGAAVLCLCWAAVAEEPAGPSAPSPRLPWPGIASPGPPSPNPPSPSVCSPPDQIASKTGKADHEIVLRSHGRHDPRNDCADLEPPAIDLDMPPGHGVVCLRRANYTIKWACGDLHCVGRKVNGVSVVYFPRPAYTGADQLRYTVHSPRGAMTFSVSLTVEPNDQPSSGAVPADISAPSGDTPQSAGPIPACPALVS